MAKTQKTAPAEAVVVEPVEPAADRKAERRERRANRPRRYRSSSVFWGLAFIVVGLLLLLDNLNIVSVHFGALWHLWPVFVIGAGLSMLSLRGWVSALISVVLAVAFGALAYFVAIDNPYYDVNSGVKEQVTVVGGDIASSAKNLNMSLKTGAMDLAIEKSAGQDYTASLSSNSLGIKQEQSNLKDDTQYVVLSTDSVRDWWLGSGDNNLTLGLTDRVPLDLRVDTGASSVHGDLSSLQLRSLALKAGASSVDLKLGSRLAKQDVTVDAGVSKLAFQVPNGVGVRVETDNGLSHTDFGDIAKVSDGIYESTGFASAETQITIHAKIGVSSFEVTRY